MAAGYCNGGRCNKYYNITPPMHLINNRDIDFGTCLAFLMRYGYCSALLAHFIIFFKLDDITKSDTRSFEELTHIAVFARGAQKYAAAT